MTKKEIVKAISDRTGLPQTQVKEIVQLTLDEIVEALLNEGRVEIRDFGVFQVKSRKARLARNPRTGLTLEVPEKFTVAFKPGKEMEIRVAEAHGSAKDSSVPTEGSTNEPFDGKAENVERPFPESDADDA